VEVKGSDSPEFKEKSIIDFVDGSIRVLITKPTICGFGMNLQHCADQIFVGLSDSYEQFYQAVRRSWRFGQKREVNVHIVTATTEGAVVANIKRKEADADKLANGMLVHMREINSRAIHGGTVRMKSEYQRDLKKGNNWTAHLGDCVEVIEDIPDDSIHYTIYSPPFASLYTYSNSDRDMGNSADHEQFFAHYKFLVGLLMKKTMPGRLVSFHCMNMQTSKVRDGVIGLTDFRGQLIKLHTDAGWIYHSEVCIWKDPVTAMQRTKALGLLHKQLKKDSCMSRQGIADYLVTMRKPGDNPERVSHTNESFPVQVWQNYASPVWMDINPSDTLQYRSAREHNDERHICPLQLEVIRRAIRLWSNPGDLILSPFMGIGSEGHVALQMGRKFVGVELKPSYWEQAYRNLENANRSNVGMFNERLEPSEASESCE
jgi:DNA modification methylase